jgi:hypothetical protein
MKCSWKATCAAIAGGMLLTLMAVAVLTAQVVSKRSVDVTVTDPYGRTVAGLEKDHFTVTEGGVQRMITAFSQVRDEDPKPAVHYRLEFDSSGPDARLEVVLNPPRGLPPLTVTWK